MDINLANSEQLRRTLKVSLSSTEVDKIFEQTLKKIQKELKLDGFRPGKVPLNIIEKRFQADVQSQVRQSVLEESFSEAEKQYDFEYAYRPEANLSEINKGSELAFQIDFEVVPQMDIVAFKDLDIDYLAPKLEDQELEDNIKQLELNISQYKPADSAVKAFDRVELIIQGWDKDKLVYNEKKDVSMIQPGAKRHLQEIEDALIGMSIDEQKEVFIKQPSPESQDDPNKDEAKTVEIKYQITAKKIERPLEFSWTKENVAKIDPNLKSIEELKKNLEEYLLRLKKDKITQQTRHLLREKLKDKLDFSLPEKILAEDYKTQKLSNKQLQALITALSDAKANKKKEVTIKKEAENTDEVITIKECESRISEIEKNLFDELKKELRFSYYAAKIAKQQHFSPREQIVQHMFDEVAREFKLHPNDLMKAPLGQRIFNQLKMEDVNNQVLNWHLPK